MFFSVCAIESGRKERNIFWTFIIDLHFLLTVCDICSQFSEFCSPFVLTLCTKKYILNFPNIFLHLYWLCAQTRQKVKAFPKFQWRPLSLLKKQQLADMDIENSVCTFWIYGPKKKIWIYTSWLSVILTFTAVKRKNASYIMKYMAHIPMKAKIAAEKTTTCRYGYRK